MSYAYKVFRARTGTSKDRLYLSIFSWRGGKHFRADWYWLERIDCPDTAYRLTKWTGCGTDREELFYDLNLTGQTCSCKGSVAHGHKGPCKHLRAALQLAKEGKLP